jgi:hypothetical protein
MRSEKPGTAPSERQRSETGLSPKFFEGETLRNRRRVQILPSLQDSEMYAIRKPRVKTRGYSLTCLRHFRARTPQSPPYKDD